MVSLLQTLIAHRRIGLDSAIFIYHFEANLKYLPLTEIILSSIEQGKCSGITSTVTIMEVTVHSWRASRSDVAREYEALLAHFPNLTVADVTRDVARKAAQLQATHTIRPADALHAATALVNGASLWVTNDKRLKRLTPEIDVIILEDFVAAPPAGT